MSTLPMPSSGGGEDFKPLSEGTHLAVCNAVVDIGTHERHYPGSLPKTQREIRISWEVPGETRTDGKPFVVTKKYTWSMHEKANLRKDLENWRGAKFGPTDFGKFDVKNLIGKTCLLSITHTDIADDRAPSGTKTVARVSAVSKPMKGMPLLDPSEKTFLWLDRDKFNEDDFNRLPERTKAEITASPEYAVLIGGKGGQNAAAGPGPVTSGFNAPAPKGATGKVHTIDDDEIPF